MNRPVRIPAEIMAAGLAPPEALADLERVAARYAVGITAEMVELIDPADPDDPIARQFVPRPQELESRPDELLDPIGDARNSPVEGLVHRYPDRVLLTPVHVCATYCRFCFRRETVGPGAAQALSQEALDAALDYIRDHPAIWEVILSGGDPLVMSPRRLGAIVEALAGIEHVRVVRIHSRVPAVEPARITPELIAALRRRGVATWLVLHANHARELTEAARAACGRLVDAGIPMLSQSVLLRGVNDDPASLEALMRAFVETRIKPYYLHHGDLAPGTSQFRTTVTEGRALMRTMRGRVSGLCQPAYVLDIPGGHGKAPIGPAYLERAAEGWDIEDWQGTRHPYSG